MRVIENQIIRPLSKGGKVQLNDLWNDGYLVIRNRQYSETFIPDYKPKANLDLTNIPISYTFAHNSCHIAFRNYQLVTFIILLATHIFSCY